MSNVETAYEFYLAHGFSPAQAAGIVGNFIQESGVNPESVQSGGPGRGIAQWSLGGRFQPSLMTGDPTIDLNSQLNFVLQELQSNPAYGLSSLLAAQTPQQAASVFSADYERPGIIGNRINDAVGVAQDATSGNWPSATSGSFTPNATLTGGNGSSILGGILGTIAPGSNLGFGGLSDVGKIGEGLGAIIGFGSQKHQEQTKANTFLGSIDELLNPTVTLFNPWGIVTMILARGAFAVFGVVLILGGIGLIIGGTKTGREAIGGIAKGAAEGAVVA